MCGVTAVGYAQNLEIKRERTFEASGLYGYMNGGADRFLEYDVKSLTVREIVYEGEEYLVEIYEMATPEDAFGIYSLHTFKCLCADTLGGINCLSAYQLQAVSGEIYASVVFPSGSQSAKEKVGELLEKYMPAADENPEIPHLLELKPPISGNLKYLRGPLSVSATNFSLADIVKGISFKGIWFVSQKPSKDYRALIWVKKSDELDKIKEKIPAADILKTGADYIYISGKEKEKENDFGDFGF